MPLLLAAEEAEAVVTAAVVGEAAAPEVDAVAEAVKAMQKRIQDTTLRRNGKNYHLMSLIRFARKATRKVSKVAAKEASPR